MGCGRCITWCPVGIDITEEVAELGAGPVSVAGCALPSPPPPEGADEGTRMQARDIRALLASHPFFAGLRDTDLDLIAGCGRNVHFRSGALLFEEGAPADTFYVVRRGMVAVETHAPEQPTIVLATHRAGDVIGWSWLLPPHRSPFDARAAQDTGVIALDGVCLRAKCDDDTDLGYRSCSASPAWPPRTCRRPACSSSTSTGRRASRAVAHPDPRQVVVDGPMVPSRHRVVETLQELPDTVTLALAPEDTPLPAGAPGQFNMLWAFGCGEVPISVSGDPTSPGPLRHTIRAVGSSTEALCAARVGDVLGVRGPFGTSWAVDRAKGRDVVVVAGGIGLAPLRPVVLSVLADRGSFGRVAILIGARSPAGVLYLDEVRRWRERSDVDVHVTVDHAEPGWWGEVGVVTRLLDHLRVDPAGTAAFVCGPEIMMRFAAAGLLDRGVPAAAIEVSLERNMKCAVAHCGHCQLGPTIVCRDGPVYTYDVAAPLLAVRGR